jgi:hypothetical protein
LENPAYIEPEMEVNTSSFDLKQRKHGKVIKLFFTRQYTTFFVKLTMLLGQIFPLRCVHPPKTKMDQE